MSRSESDGTWHLSPDDERACDCRFGDCPAAARGPGDAARSRRVEEVLKLLDAGQVPASDATLVDATLARISRLERRAMVESSLSMQDDLAMEAYVSAGYRLDRVPGSLRARAERVEAIVALVTTAAQTPHDAGLVERTMAAIPVRLRRSEERSWRTVAGSFRLLDLVSVAAMLLLGVSVVWPVLAATRTHQMKTGCGANLGTIASALGLYSGDHGGALPVATAGLSGPSWLQVGSSPDRSNSANLFTLAKSGYSSLKQMACPGNAHADCGGCRPQQSDWRSLDEVSYSYQVLFGTHKPSWENGPRVVILGDASPVIRRQLAGLPWHPLQNSANHNGDGQWVLRNDGSGAFLNSPVTGGDNIWLPGLVEVAISKVQDRVRRGETSGTIEIRGDEVPDSASDSFLGP